MILIKLLVIVSQWLQVAADLAIYDLNHDNNIDAYSNVHLDKTKVNEAWNYISN